jgi:FkbM family methyltransferase
MNTKKLILAGLVFKSLMGFITLVFFSSYVADSSSKKCSLVQRNSNQLIDSNPFYKLYEQLITDIYNSSEQQSLINKKVLLTTLRFMIEETDKDDAELVNFVQQLIQPPSKQKLRLESKNSDLDYSQHGQSKFMDDQLKFKENGFFVEAGAYDGEYHSNSLYFELKRNWTGILIEPVPSSYASILKKRRNAYALNACIASDQPILAKFKAFKSMSGREKEMSSEHKNKIELEAQATSTKPETLYVPCFSLHTILKALDVKIVDYFTLDVEGGEFDVLKRIDFGQLEFKAISIEYNSAESVKKFAITHHLTNSNFKLVKTSDQDLFFIKK